MSGNKKQLTPVLELYIRCSWPELVEKDIFRFPFPISVVSFCGLVADIIPTLCCPISLENKKIEQVKEEISFT